MARGSVIKRGGAWRVIVELSPDPATGKRRQRFETVNGSKREADKRLTELLALADRQQLGATSKDTLSQFLDHWLRGYAASRAPSTYERYCQLVKNQVVPYLGNIRLDRLTPSHLVSLFSTLRDTKRLDRRSGKLSPQTLMHVFRMLHTALESARKWQLIPRNPLDDVEAPRVPRVEMKTFDVAQTQSFMAASSEEGPKWQAFFTLAVTTGMRIGELRGLRWQDLALESGGLQVHQSMKRVPRAGMVARQPKTSAGRRPVALGDDVTALLRHHKAEQNVERLQLGPLWQDSNLVFPSRVGTPLEDKRIREVFFRICDRAGLPRMRPYDLRHSCASLLLAAGVHPKIVAERLGHSSVSLTLGTYSHVLPGLQKDAASTMDRLLKATP